MLAPEANPRLHGHCAAERQLLEAYCGGRLHHAWLIDGPGGVGKATLAYRFARFLLANPRPEAAAGAADLAVAQDEPAFRQVATRVHPNLFVLERPRNDKGQFASGVIPVEQVRRLGHFLAGTAAGRGWRIVVVDAADELNRSSANALLKMLEEPPRDTVFLVLSHQPGRLLPTIRSRCRRLPLAALDDAALVAALQDLSVPPDEATRNVLRLARGSVGRACMLLAEQDDGLVDGLVEILDALPRAPASSLLAFAEQTGRRDRDTAFRLARGVILDWMSARVHGLAEQGQPPAVLAPWSEVWEKVEHAFAQAETLNLDRTQTLLGVFQALSDCAVSEMRRTAPRTA